MNTLTRFEGAITSTGASEAASHRTPIEQIVLVFQGGGALAAYQAGVYQALTEGGIELDWVIGTSIGAINGALIAGNRPGERLGRLQEFWTRLGRWHLFDELWSAGFFGGSFANFGTITEGVPGFFEVNPHALWGLHMPVGIDKAAFYSTAPLERTLKELDDFEYLNNSSTRLTVGAVSVRTGEMRYFDTRDRRLGPEHVMASGALPPGFPAVRVDGEPYWDRGLYSNTPNRVGVRRQTAAQLADLLGQYVAATRLRARDDLAGARPAKGYPICKSRPQPCRTAGADPSPPPRDSRARKTAPVITASAISRLWRRTRTNSNRGISTV